GLGVTRAEGRKLDGRLFWEDDQVCLLIRRALSSGASAPFAASRGGAHLGGRGDQVGWLICLHHLASCIARHRRSGVAGISMGRMPNSESASISALPPAGSAPTLPASPAPLIPSGLVSVGTGWLSQWIAENVSARGIA